MEWGEKEKIKSFEKHASLKAIEVLTFPVEGQERGKPQRRE